MLKLRTRLQSSAIKFRCTARQRTATVTGPAKGNRKTDDKSELESALCGDANPRRLPRQSCCG